MNRRLRYVQAQATPAGRVALLGVLTAFAVGLVLHLQHRSEHELVDLAPLVHWLRDAALSTPVAVVVVLVATSAVRRLIAAHSIHGDSLVARLLWATIAGSMYAASTVPGNWVHHFLFVEGAATQAEHHDAGIVAHSLHDASRVIWPSIAIMLAATALVGLPWQWSRVVRTRRAAPAIHVPDGRRAIASGIAVASLLVGLAPLGDVVSTASAAPTDFACGMWPGTRTVQADVVALDQRIVYNRLGVVNPYGMIYALREDVVVASGAEAGTPISATSRTDLAGNVMLRPDKRPRPITLRANVGDCLRINFENLLSPSPLPEQPADRNVGLHANGLQLVDGIASDGSFVGRNASSLVAPGESTTYTLFAEYENTYLLYNLGATVGSEGGGGTIAFGLFGAINVEPFGTRWYRSQLTRVEMDLAASAWTGDVAAPGGEPQVDANGQPVVRTTADGQPIINYAARYPMDPTHPWYEQAKAGRPIVDMLDGTQLVHADLNAVIAGPASDGYRIPHQAYPLSYWDNQVANQEQYRGGEPFREFTVIFHDEIVALQSFPAFFGDPVLRHTLQGVKDGFAINYGTGGIGAEIIANRIGVGPMRECVECKYEEFFLSSWAVGDPAMIVDVPANADAAGVPTNEGGGPVVPGPKATVALYPDDPSNVHHSYLGDRVKFRNLHAGPKEHHVFHLHAQQWQYDWNTEKSGYLDSQNIGPGGGFTYEVAYGGSGNRNLSAGDAIFHCHFYPHFAQGMWELWRIHDTFERGTVLGADGRPEPGARAFPDGEIVAGTPIPGVVPLPSRPMAPMPDAASGVAPFDLDGDGVDDSSQVDVDGNGTADVAQVSAGGHAFDTAMPSTNPGYPFFIPGVAGHRPPTPAIDLSVDGGLERHVVLDGTADSFATRLDFNKELTTLRLGFIPEGGTPAELAAMEYHATAPKPSFTPDGTPASFVVNGLPAQPGAPYADPCRADSGAAIPTSRTYKGAVVQLDLEMNKEGWHFQQQRILALDEDVGATLTNGRPPEPLVMRIEAGDCVRFEHTNLTPNVYEMDDYQVRTPTDVIGQHIHLVKFDVTSSDGSGNGFNYEDGTFSPQEVEERIEAVRHQSTLDVANGVAGATDCAAVNGTDHRLDANEVQSTTCPLAERHPYFGNVPGVGELAWGARTTVQRWYADPLLNNAWDNGLGSVFTHDHFGPSTHQQVGLYATVLVEPTGTKWLHNETAAPLGTRADGGPTSWQAMIVDDNGAAPPGFVPHREFYFEFADFQHAYERGGGAPTTMDNGAGTAITTFADFANAVNPSIRREAPSPGQADLYFFPPVCPGGVPRPCPEAISAEDPGTYVVNYRNEPVGARIFDPATGAQAAGDAGDLAYAYGSIPRANPALNVQPTTYPPLTRDVGPLDPYTPLIRSYMGDQVRIRVQAGAHEEEHTFTIDGMRWLHEPLNPNSGWRNSGSAGISEYFVLDTPTVVDTGRGSPAKVDYRYTMGAGTEDLWNGVWGIFRTYGKLRTDLAKLPTTVMASKGLTITNEASYNESCPNTAPVRTYRVAAVRAADVLGPAGLVYNDRATTLVDDVGTVVAEGPLQDPGALMYVFAEDLVLDPATGQPVGLRPGTPTDPLVLRAAAGECIVTELTNYLPTTIDDLPGYNALPPIIKKGIVHDPLLGQGIVTFNSNDVRPSSIVGLTPQLVSRNLRTQGAEPVGTNSHSPIRPGQTGKYTWYAGITETRVVDAARGRLELVSRPIEFGAVNLMPTDTIEGVSKGLVGALVVEPPGATWVTDPESHVEATVSFPDGSGTVEFREFVTVLQNDVNLRYGGGCTPTAANLQCAVPNLSQADDAQDTGARAINYGAEPLWYRLGMAPESTFAALAGRTDAHTVFSNELVGGADPQTAVFTVSPAKDQAIRMRMVMPGGHARGTEITTHGHPWQRQPYVQDSDRISWTFHDDPTTLDGADIVRDGRHTGQMASHNMVSWWTSSQESIGASSHFDMVFRRGGGRARVEGDFLFRDFASFGSLGGTWGLIRHAPTPARAAADRYVAAHDGSLAVSDPAAGLLANDLDLDGDAFTAALVGSGTTVGGSVVVNPDGTFTYQSAPGFTGIDSFDYAVTGGDTATVQITVPNAAPVAAPDAATTHGGSGVAGKPVVIAVLANDADADGDALTVSTAAADAVVNPDGTITYTPPADAAQGTTAEVRTFEYTVSDGFGGTSSATVTVTISPNGLPVAGDDAASATVGGPPVVVAVLANDSDPDGDPLAIIDVSAPEATANADGSINYTPPVVDPGGGTATFTYSVSDGFGGTATAAVTVTFGANAPPSAVDDSASTRMNTPVTVGVLANDSDPDNDPLTVTVGVPSVGSASTNGASITYTPPSGFSGVATVPYTISDGRGGTSSAVLTVTVRDTVAITEARYTPKTKRWTIQGTVAPAGSGVRVVVTLNGIRLADVATDPSTGAWRFTGTGPAPRCSPADSVAATSSRGGTATRLVVCR